MPPKWSRDISRTQPPSRVGDGRRQRSAILDANARLKAQTRLWQLQKNLERQRGQPAEWLEKLKSPEWLAKLAGPEGPELRESLNWLIELDRREMQEGRQPLEWLGKLKIPEGLVWLATTEGLELRKSLNWLYKHENLERQRGQPAEWLEKLKSPEWLAKLAGLEGPELRGSLNWLMELEWYEMHKGRQPPEWLGKLKSSEGLVWLKNPEGQILRENIDWLHMLENHEIQEGRHPEEWLEKLKTLEGLAWLATPEGLAWRKGYNGAIKAELQCRSSIEGVFIEQQVSSSMETNVRPSPESRSFDRGKSSTIDQGATLSADDKDKYVGRFRKSNRDKIDKKVFGWAEFTHAWTLVTSCKKNASVRNYKDCFNLAHHWIKAHSSILTNPTDDRIQVLYTEAKQAYRDYKKCCNQYLDLSEQGKSQKIQNESLEKASDRFKDAVAKYVTYCRGLIDEQKYSLLNISNIGKNKPLGYVTDMHIKDSRQTIDNIIKSKINEGLCVCYMKNEVMHGGDLYCLFVYDYNALENVLQKHASTLRDAEWPSDPDEFVLRVSKERVSPKTPLYNVVADAFGSLIDDSRTDVSHTIHTLLNHLSVLF